MAQPHNQSVLFRKDDNAVLISTDAYVSHRKQAGPWRSTFSMTMDDAKKLRDELSQIISENETCPKLENLMTERTFGQTPNCRGCRHWSEMAAKADAGGVSALCLNQKSPKKGEFMPGWYRCDFWQEGSLGATDTAYQNPYEDDGKAA